MTQTKTCFLAKQTPCFHNNAGTTTPRKRKRPLAQHECDGIIASGTMPGTKKMHNMFLSTQKSPDEQTPPLPTAPPPPNSINPYGVAVQNGLLKWARAEHGLLLQHIDGRGWCGYDAGASILGVTRTELLLSMHTAVAPYDEDMVNKHCYGRHCGSLHLPHRANVFKIAIRENAAGAQSLGSDAWYSMDDTRILAMVFDKPILVFSNKAKESNGKLYRDPYPIVLYLPSNEATFYRTAVEFRTSNTGLVVSVGLAHSVDHFNAMVKEEGQVAEV